MSALQSQYRAQNLWVVSKQHQKKSSLFVGAPSQTVLDSSALGLIVKSAGEFRRSETIVSDWYRKVVVSEHTELYFMMF